MSCNIHGISSRKLRADGYRADAKSKDILEYRNSFWMLVQVFLPLSFFIRSLLRLISNRLVDECPEIKNCRFAKRFGSVLKERQLVEGIITVRMIDDDAE